MFLSSIGLALDHVGMEFLGIRGELCTLIHGISGVQVCVMLL
jgi:hypothetical protein